MTTISYSEACANLAALTEESASDREVIIISRRGKEAMALLPASELAGLLETVHLLCSPHNAGRLLRTIACSEQHTTGTALIVEKLQQRFGLEE